MFRVVFYETADGKTPVEDFLLGLEAKLKAKAVAMMKLLEEKGTALRMPYTEHLRDGIFELRVVQGSNAARILFFFYFENQIIVTNGFLKKRQKTPEREIRLAEKRRKDYLQRAKLNEKDR